MCKTSVFKIIGAAALAALLCVGCADDGGYKLIIDKDPWEGGSVRCEPEQSVYGAGDTVFLTATPNRGYEFVGWSGASNRQSRTITVTMNSDVKLTARFRQTGPAQTVGYTVTFNANGGSGAPPEQYYVQEGSSITLPNQGGLTKSGYDFDGWYTNKDGTGGTRYGVGESYTPKGNDTLYAKWNVSGTLSAAKTVTFDANGGTVSPASGTTDADGTLASLPTPKRSESGYTFNGWYTAVTGGAEVTTSTVFTRDATVYARWTFIMYTITFDAKGGVVTPMSDTTVAGGKLASLPKPTRSGYAFAAWYTADTGGTEVKTSTVFDKDTTIYARWVRSYTVRFDAKGGSVDPNIGKTDANGRLDTLPVPIRGGYVFDHWYTTADTGGAAVTRGAAGTVFGKDTTIYARWLLNTYTITFNANGGAVSPPSGATGEGGKLASLPVPTRSGYFFNGWYTAATNGEAVTLNTVFTESKVIYAQWSTAPATPPSGTTFADSRDSTVYKKVTIGTQVWMAENLNYAEANGVCYDGDDDNCANYGRLYNFADALAACPAGWHLPTDAEWTVLTDYIGGAEAAGTKLKSSIGWNGRNGNGADVYGFSALPGGYRYSVFNDVGNYGHWWSATERNEYTVWCRSISSGGANVGRINGDKAYLFSVRCVEDGINPNQNTNQNQKK